MERVLVQWSISLWVLVTATRDVRDPKFRTLLESKRESEHIPNVYNTTSILHSHGSNRACRNIDWTGNWLHANFIPRRSESQKYTQIHPCNREIYGKRTVKQDIQDKTRDVKDRKDIKTDSTGWFCRRRCEAAHSSGKLKNAWLGGAGTEELWQEARRRAERGGFWIDRTLPAAQGHVLHTGGETGGWQRCDLVRSGTRAVGRL